MVVTQAIAVNQVVPIRVEKRQEPNSFSSFKPFFTLNFKQTQLPEDLVIAEVPRTKESQDEYNLKHFHVILEKAYIKATLKWRCAGMIDNVNGLFVSQQKFMHLGEERKTNLSRLRNIFMEEVLNMTDFNEEEVCYLLNIRIFKKEKYIIWIKVKNYNQWE